jgi:hypothetical protein
MAGFKLTQTACLRNGAATIARPDPTERSDKQATDRTAHTGYAFSNFATVEGVFEHGFRWWMRFDAFIEIVNQERPHR